MITKCEHGVYDPHGDAAYCSCCNPIVVISKSRFERIDSDSVGVITISSAPEVPEDSKWEKELRSQGLSTISEDGLLDDERSHLDELCGQVSLENFSELSDDSENADEDDISQRDVLTASNQDTMGQLRRKLDGQDGFMGGHQIMKIRGRCRRVPEWTRSDKSVREVLLLAFPKMNTSGKQRARAARWGFIIYRYFRMQQSRGLIAKELKTTDKAIRWTIERIVRAASGKNTFGASRKPMGRPKSLATNQTPSGGEKQPLNSVQKETKIEDIQSPSLLPSRARRASASEMPLPRANRSGGSDEPGQGWNSTMDRC